MQYSELRRKTVEFVNNEVTSFPRCRQVMQREERWPEARKGRQWVSSMSHPGARVCAVVDRHAPDSDPGVPESVALVPWVCPGLPGTNQASIRQRGDKWGLTRRKEGRGIQPVGCGRLYSQLLPPALLVWVEQREGDKADRRFCVCVVAGGGGGVREEEVLLSSDPTWQGPNPPRLHPRN